MIRRLVLEAWRAYDHLQIDLEPGTTFVVARNGIGKTSLVEGAAWALYGEAAGRPANAVRRGRKSGSATVEVVLPDGRVLSVTRTMPQRLARNSETPATAEVDGAPVPDGELATLLDAQLGADAPFLARLTMLRGLRHGLADEASLALDENLMKVFGIDGLHRALDELSARRKIVARQIRDARQTTPTSAAQRIALHEEVARLAGVVAAAEAEHRAAAEAEAAARRTVETAAAAVAWRQGDARRIQEVAVVAASVAGFIGREPVGGQTFDDDPAATLIAAVDVAEASIVERLNSVRVNRAVIADRILRLQEALGELDRSGGWCPVCRRPLGPDETETARQGHLAEIAALEQEQEGAPTAPHVAALAAIQAAKNRGATLRRQPEPQVAAEFTPEQAGSAAEAAASSARSALDAVVHARTAAASAENALAEAMEDEQADTALIELYRQQGLIDAAITAATASADGLMSKTVAPLTEELASRWKALFDDRGDLLLRSGAVSRTVNGLDLPFSAFSDGEQISAQLLLRLLVLDAATRAGFCWIDEPLEHLDPSTRRHVASLLSRARSNSGLRQVVVTTYEEPLARRLALRHPDETRVVYVRQDRPS